MTFQIITNDGHILTVHSEVGEGLSKIVIDDSKPAEDDSDLPIEPDESL